MLASTSREGGLLIQGRQLARPRFALDVAGIAFRERVEHLRELAAIREEAMFGKGLDEFLFPFKVVGVGEKFLGRISYCSTMNCLVPTLGKLLFGEQAEGEDHRIASGLIYDWSFFHFCEFGLAAERGVFASRCLLGAKAMPAPFSS